MILFALLVAHRVNSNCYKEQLRIPGLFHEGFLKT